MELKIVADSACDLKAADVDCEAVEFTTVPFHINVGDLDIVDDDLLDTDKLLSGIEDSQVQTKTACPAPDMWAEQYDEKVATIALTISSELSGSFNSAHAASSMSENDNIVILDSRSTGPAIAMCIKHIVAWAKEGHSLGNIRDKAEALLHETNTVFALCSFENLVKAGRMHRLVGFVARKLGMWGIGKGVNGRISIKGKTIGASKMIAAILNDMKDSEFSGNEVIISHCCNENLARRLYDCIKEKWENARITILAARGLNSFYAERGGLIIAYR